nr:DUF3955 domain-containing protein [Burkholderia pseudomallei]
MTPFTLQVVAAITLIATIVMVAGDARYRPYWTICTCFMLAGFACWLAFAAIGSEVDAQGVLHEPIALLPLGWLLVGIGCVGSLFRGAMVLCCRHRDPSTDGGYGAIARRQQTVFAPEEYDGKAWCNGNTARRRRPHRYRRESGRRRGEIAPAARRAGSIRPRHHSSGQAEATFSLLLRMRLNPRSPAMNASSMCGIRMAASTASP